MKVFVYFNLHRKLFSVKALEGDMKGRVIAHRKHVLLTDATFKVSEAGRQRVIREQRKNVHAGVSGTWFEDDVQHGADKTSAFITINGSAITYNPYKYSTFVHLYGEHPITSARLVALNVSESKRASIHTWD
jgi:hypothetical protein